MRGNYGQNRLLLALAAVVSLILVAASVPPASKADEQRPCVGDNRGLCLVRPHRLFTGAHTWVRGIHWRRWNRSTAVGYGTLVESAIYAHFAKSAKVRLRLPAECSGLQWFWSMTINFGSHFRRPYLHNYNFTPCA